MFRVYFVIFIFISPTVSYGQVPVVLKTLSGKKFVSKQLEYFEVLNDSLLYSSINPYEDTAQYSLENDTIYIRQKYWRTDQGGTKQIKGIYSYKLLSLAPDTIKLKNQYQFNYKPDNWEDSLVFVNIEKLKESVKDFKSLKLDFSSPWSGTRHITIAGSGNVIFIDSAYDINHPSRVAKPKTKRIYGQLSQKEFSNFKNLLSNSLPSRLPSERGCPIDGEESDFVIEIGSKTIISRGCDLRWIHTFLLNYLYNIDKNNGFIRHNQSKAHIPVQTRF